MSKSNIAGLLAATVFAGAALTLAPTVAHAVVDTTNYPGAFCQAQIGSPRSSAAGSDERELS